MNAEENSKELNNDNRKSFVLYTDYYSYISFLTPDEKAKLFDAIFQYVLEFKTPDFSGALGIAFSVIKTQLDRDTEKVNDNVNVNDSIIYCSELQTTSEPSGPPIFSLPLNNNSEYKIFNTDVIDWCNLYPSVDIMQELRKMKGWLNANPKRRKTKSGIKRFINNWLSKEQDRYKPHDEQPKNKNGFLTILEKERNNQ